MEKPKAPKFVDRDHVLVEGLQPDVGHSARGENWAVIHRGITRRKASVERQFLRDGGVYLEPMPDNPDRQRWHIETPQQWSTWEAYLARRVALFVREWSFQDDEGEILPVSVESAGELDDNAFMRLVNEIGALEAPRGEDERFRGDDATAGLGGASPDAPGQPAAGVGEGHVGGEVVSQHRLSPA